MSTTKNKLENAVHHIRYFADAFITHWIDDDDKESQAAAKRAEAKTDAAKATLDRALQASRVMLAALRKANDAMGCDACPQARSAVRAAIDAATAAGIRS